MFDPVLSLDVVSGLGAGILLIDSPRSPVAQSATRPRVLGHSSKSGRCHSRAILVTLITSSQSTPHVMVSHTLRRHVVVCHRTPRPIAEMSGDEWEIHMSASLKIEQEQAGTGGPCPALRPLRVWPDREICMTCAACVGARELGAGEDMRSRRRGYRGKLES